MRSTTDGGDVAYERLRTRLQTPPAPRLSTLPDGSIDHYCRLSAGAVGPLTTRQTLGREIQDTNRSSFRMQIESTEPGGQAVNVATQLAALDAAVTCYGHLDHPLFEDLSFDQVSMGEPATVYAFNFTDSDIMFVEGSIGQDWSLADLRAVADLRDVFDVDAICCTNWVSFPGLESTFHTLASMDLPRRPFILDPGDLIGSQPDDIDSLQTALAALQGTFDVVFNGNRQEVRATATTLPDPPNTDRDRLAAIQSQTGISAAVMHAPEEAIVATATDITRVETRHVDSPRRHTGGGDRFTAGLGFALGAGWAWDLALACGNACANYYVETGETASISTLRAYLDQSA